MASNQFTALIRLPFIRGNFEDPLQAQWDAEKDRQLWKVISKSSKTSDLNWAELATKFQVPPTFILQQAAWLYERHLDHVRNQMKRVSISNTTGSPTPTGGSTLTAVGGVAMQRTGSGGVIGGVSMRRNGSGGSEGLRTASALSGRPRDSSSLRGGETVPFAPPLSRTPSTNTITQSRAHAQPTPARTHSTRSVQRPNLTSPRPEERTTPSTAPPMSYRRESAGSPDIPASPSSSSSSLSDTNHPAHRSQLFKRPPRFKQQRPRELSNFDEDDRTREVENSGSHGIPSLPFASTGRGTQASDKYGRETLLRAGNKHEQEVLKADRIRNAPVVGQNVVDQHSQATTDTASSMTSSVATSDIPTGPRASGKAPMSPSSDHRSELGRLGSPRLAGPRVRKEGSEGTPSMGSSFSDIDDAGISQSALEEALLSNIQHGQMSTLSRMSRFI